MAKRRSGHDAFFKTVLGTRGAAEALARERLPGPVARRIVARSVRVMPGSFIDEALRATQSDVLLRARLSGGGRALIYCLVEHKSVPDRWVALQLARYMVRVWQRLRRESRGPLPPIFPLVVYHGRGKWPVSRRFCALLNVDDDTRSGGFDFEYGLLDVGQEADETLSSDGALRGGLWALKYARHPELQHQVLRRVVRECLLAGGLPWSEVVAYVSGNYEQVTTPELIEAVREVEPERTDAMISLAARQWLAEGEAVGLEKGLEQGLEKGQREASAAILLRLLRRRFTRVPVAQQERIKAASLGTLERWFDRAVDAPTLADVFAARRVPPGRRSA